MSDIDWSEVDAAPAGNVICSECGSDQFRLGVNSAESVKIECRGCDFSVAHCWSDSTGNNIHALQPRQQMPEGDTEDDSDA